MDCVLIRLNFCRVNFEIVKVLVYKSRKITTVNYIKHRIIEIHVMRIVHVQITVGYKLSILISGTVVNYRVLKDI